MSESGLCLRLDWDSDFFGLNIARVQATRLDEEIVGQALAWGRSHNVDCLYFLADAGDAATVRLAEENNFRFVDIRITLDRRLPGEVALEIEKEGPGGIIRPYRPDDITALKAVAAASHHDSRFYNDPNFPRALSDALYETWIEKSCNGYAEKVFVAEVEGEAGGYISCHLRAGGEGNIGLVGIAGRLQGKGLGGKLVNTALKWFIEQGIERVTVVTQGRNAGAQRLYQRRGFVTRETQLWYHLWFRN